MSTRSTREGRRGGTGFGTPGVAAGLAAIVTLILCAGCDTASSPGGASNFVLRPDPALEARIHQVLSGLRPAVRFTNRPDDPDGLAERMDHYLVPAVSIAVVHDGRLEWARAFGRKESGSEAPATTETLFHAKSVSKAVAAALTLRLVERGVLALDAPVNRRLTSWSVPDNEFTRATEPTLRHLLSHSAGFTEHGVDSFLPSETIPTLLETIRGETPAADTITVDFEPGTAHRYSGGGYGVLQQLLEDATGRPFAVLADSLVFQPLAMRHSYYPLRFSRALAPFAATGHDVRGEPIPGGYEILPMQAAGGLWTNATDLARFVVALQSAWNGTSGRFLDSATVREMMKPQAADWGLGVQLERIEGELRFSHGGSGDGFKAVVVGYLERGDGAVVLANGDGAGALREELLRSVAQAYGWPGYRRREHTVADVAPRHLRSYAGTYEWASGIRETVRFDEGRLETRFGDEGRFERLFPLGEGRFVTTGGGIYRFETDASERVTALISVGEDVEYEATPVH